MTQFQLVFRTTDGDVSELRDNSEAGEARVNGVLLIDGVILALRGSEWLVSRDDLPGMTRFVCTPIGDRVEH